MPRRRAPKVPCPICKKPTKPSDADFPFCSERCRVIDLGKWASGHYVIPGPLMDTDEGIEDSGDNPAIPKAPGKPQ